MRRLLVGLVAALSVVGTAQLEAIGGDWPWSRPKAGEGISLEQVAREIDCIEDKILDDGTVVIKQPDVYGQARMTLYRKNFETMMYGAIGNFNAVISARIFRSDQAALSSQTNLAAGLGAAGGTPAKGAAASTSSASTTVVPPPLYLTDSGAIPDALATNSIVRPDTIAAPLNTPFTFGGVNPGTGSIGLEPSVYLDELKHYQEHLNEIRRINMGDDIADSAGYGLYQIRMPVSIQPGELTHKGHGAILTVTARHDFGPDFLYTTFRNLAINDLVDQLGPVVYELIRSKALDAMPVR